MGLTAARPGIVIGQSRAFGLARIATAVFFCFLAVTPGAAAVQPNSSVDRSLDELLDKWRCPVAAYLERIHRFPPKLENRYLILWSRRHPEFYVQCIFQDEDRQLYCEAASGFYLYRDKIGSFATPRRLDALARLGFSTDDSKGNFSLDRPFNGSDVTATLMIETLARVFDFDASDVMEYAAPLLSKRLSNGVKAGSGCAKISALWSDWPSADQRDAGPPSSPGGRKPND